MPRRSHALRADQLLDAYRHGLFPMADSRDSDRLFWMDPEERGIIPLDGFHIPRRLLRTVRSGLFQVTVDQDFGATIAACATPMPGREDTWINARIQQVYGELHRMGHAHSVECRRQGVLVGGLYGVSLGSAFFGESMFSFVTDASKVALAHLIARLRLGGYRLLDTQFVTAHLSRFGAISVPRLEYRSLLMRALAADARWLDQVDPDVLDAEFRMLVRAETGNSD